MQLSHSSGSLQHEAYLECTSVLWICLSVWHQFPLLCEGTDTWKIEHPIRNEPLLSGWICFAICQQHLRADSFLLFQHCYCQSIHITLAFSCVGWREEVVLGGGGVTAAERRRISCILDESKLTADINGGEMSPVWLLSKRRQSFSSAKFWRLLTGFAQIGFRVS